MIRISEPQLGPDVESLVLEVLRSGRLAQGPMVERLEELCAAMAGAQHAVAVSNGTTALDVALEASGIGPGDEVITTPLTFAATLNAIIRSGADVRFADVSDDYTIDPDAVRSLIGPRTAAIVPVHLYGLPADVPSLASLATDHGLLLLEDAAQAHGAAVDGVPVGAAGVATFSFYATKNVTAGEGGVVTTDDGDVADRIRLLRNQGMARPYEYTAIGQNLRMTELQAAVAIPQLERLGSIIATRKANAATLSAALKHRSDVTLPEETSGRSHVWHQYTALLSEGHARPTVVESLAQRGVQAGIYYPSLVWDHAPYRDSRQVLADPTPRAARVVRQCLSLPIHPGLTAADLEGVSAAFGEVLDSQHDH